MLLSQLPGGVASTEPCSAVEKSRALHWPFLLRETGCPQGPLIALGLVVSWCSCYLGAQTILCGCLSFLASSFVVLPLSYEHNAVVLTYGKRGPNLPTHISSDPYRPTFKNQQGLLRRQKHGALSASQRKGSPCTNSHSAHSTHVLCWPSRAGPSWTCFLFLELNNIWLNLFSFRN